MQKEVKSRFCNHCEKSVRNFQNQSNAENLLHLLENYNNSTCIRASKEKFKFSDADFIKALQLAAISQKSKHLFFAIMSVGTLLFSQQNTAIAQESKANKIEVIEDGGMEIIGEIAMPTTTKDLLLNIVDKMPEFPGGHEALFQFIEQKLEYPKWELGNKISGITFVTFEIDNTGLIRNPRVLRNIEGSKNTDAESLRVIKMMPNWIPGEQNGKKITVRFNLPIRFTL